MVAKEDGVSVDELCVDLIGELIELEQDNGTELAQVQWGFISRLARIIPKIIRHAPKVIKAVPKVAKAVGKVGSVAKTACLVADVTVGVNPCNDLINGLK